MIGGPENGERPARVGPIGEFTDVASANRAVRGVFKDNEDELDEVRGRTVTAGPFFSSEAFSSCV